jgi:putative DNA primase/helicase
VKIDKSKADPDLAKKLKSELSGILIWAIEGLGRFIRNGKKLSKSSTLENLEQAYKEDTDTVVMFLSVKMCVPDNDNKIGLTPLFNNYREYCRDNNQKAETRENFKMKLKSEGYVVEEDNKKGVKIGISSSIVNFSLPFD